MWRSPLSVAEHSHSFLLNILNNEMSLHEPLPLQWVESSTNIRYKHVFTGEGGKIVISKTGSTGPARGPMSSLVRILELVLDIYIPRH